MNEVATRNQKSDPRFFKGGSYHHYLNHEPDHKLPLFLSYTDPLEPWTQRESRARDGVHSGKGPRGYKRSDERILEEVNDSLTRNSYLDATEVTVKVFNSVVTLSGKVLNREMKKVAEYCADMVHGVRDVQNKIVIP